MIRRLAMSGFGLGYAPVASGTFGSAGAAAIAAIIWAVSVYLVAIPLNVAWVVLTAIASAACVYWGPWAVEYYSARARKAGDPGHVVIDEFAGQWIALLAMPFPGAGGWLTAAAILALQFFLFRVFDVVKPPPARQLEKLPAGWGILMDDLAAGVYANLVGQVLVRWVL